MDPQTAYELPIVCLMLSSFDAADIRIPICSA